MKEAKLAIVTFCSVLFLYQSIYPQDLDTVTAKLQSYNTEEGKLFLLGTLHGAHARNQKYTWAHFDRIVSAISPDLILVEIRPEHFKAEEFYSDGPPEMAYIVQLALTKGIRCQGMDWWPDEWLYHFSSLTQKDFDQREDSMFTYIVSAMKANKAKTTLVATGAGHIDGFVARLKQKGYKESVPPPVNLTFSKYPDLPLQVLNLWEQGATYLSKLPLDSTDRIKQKVNFLRQLVTKKGYEFDTSKK